MLRIGICGAGIGGLAAAIALRNAGHYVELFERASELREIGTGLTLWSNATQALQDLGAYPVPHDDGRELAILHLDHWQGHRLMRIPTESFRTPALGLKRTTLHTLLKNRVPEAILHLNHTVTESIRQADKVCLKFHTGELSAAFDLVVAADGLHSRLRPQVLGFSDPLRYQGYSIWRGLWRGEIPSLPTGAFQEIWGPGKRFGLFPVGANHWCWYAVANRPFAEVHRPESRRQDLQLTFNGWPTQVVRAIQESPEILRHDAVDRPSARCWSKDLVLLVGDAAHPMPPNLGQGGSMALEDAVTLAHCLPQTHTALEDGLRRFQALRQPRVDSIAGRSARIGFLAQWQQPWAVLLRDQACQLIPGTLFTWTSRSIHRGFRRVP